MAFSDWMYYEVGRVRSVIDIFLINIILSMYRQVR